MDTHADVARTHADVARMSNRNPNGLLNFDQILQAIALISTESEMQRPIDELLVILQISLHDLSLQ